MNRLIPGLLIVSGYLLLQSCATQNHANTIEPDKDNPCLIHLVVQVGVDGNDSDVIAVREQLEPCFTKECPIPCSNDSSKGCKVMTNVIVKKWSDLSDKDKPNFHHVTMVPDDKLPSRAQIGTPNGPGVNGTWRRNAVSPTYCHETLHLLGLRDQYCSRLFNAVDSTHPIVEINCKTPPDPENGSCCTPTRADPRCSTPCEGHNNDLMATLDASLSCQNIIDVLKKAGMDKCSEACCNSSHTYRMNEFYIAPSYLHFGDKDFHFNAYGGSIDYTYKFKPKLGLTLDLGYYGHNEKDTLTEGGLKNHIFSLGTGLKYYPQLFGANSKLDFSAHAYMGIMHYQSKYNIPGYGSETTNKTSICPNLGAALDYNLNSKWDIRLLQVDYMPSFFYSNTQNNYRFSVGAGWRW